MTTFSLFEEEEVLKYVFYLFDSDKNGYLAGAELHNLIQTMHEMQHTEEGETVKGMGNNAKRSLTMFMEDELKVGIEGAVNFKNFCLFNRKYPMTLAPIFGMQTEIQLLTFGREWWDFKKHKLEHGRAQKARKAELERKSTWQQLEKQLYKTAMYRMRGCCFCNDGCHSECWKCQGCQCLWCGSDWRMKWCFCCGSELECMANCCVSCSDCLPCCSCQCKRVDAGFCELLGKYHWHDKKKRSRQAGKHRRFDHRIELDRGNTTDYENRNNAHGCTVARIQWLGKAEALELKSVMGPAMGVAPEPEREPGGGAVSLKSAASASAVVTLQPLRDARGQELGPAQAAKEGEGAQASRRERSMKRQRARAGQKGGADAVKKSVALTTEL
jgi:hypothetical protein